MSRQPWPDPRNPILSGNRTAFMRFVFFCLSPPRARSNYSRKAKNTNLINAVLLPFATKGEVELFKKGDELVVQIGTFRRHIGLPRSMAALLPSRAKLESKVLTVEMKETP